MENESYDEFLHEKIVVAPESGFEARAEDLNPRLKPHQRDAVVWALKGGRRCLRASGWARQGRSWNGAGWWRNTKRGNA